MQATLIENNGNGRIAYDSLIMNNPAAFSALGNKIALRIIKALSEYPSSAIDISRKLKIHEQKIYYHMKKLEKSGIIYTISNEKRHGMIAKIYSIVSPVISTKLHDKGIPVKESTTLDISKNMREFFSPFVTEGKLNAKIVIGDPSPHGEYNSSGTEGAHVTDFMLFLGRFIETFEFPNYRLDTEIRESDIHENLILIGNSKTNAIINKIKSSLPISFDLDKNAIVSKSTKNVYKDDRCGTVIKMDNPLNAKKKILVIGGLRTRGTRAALMSLLKLDDSFLSSKNRENLHYIVQGMDKDSDMIIDDMIMLE